jgi:DNA-binding GntR family transcriptional regulator
VVTESADGLGRSLLSDQAYTLLRGQLLAAEHAPGTRLVESEIARRLAVSQAPVREALRRLAHEGLVLQLPHRGSFVAGMSADEARKSYAVRAALEVVAVDAVVESDDPELIPRLVTALEEDLAAMIAAADRDDIAAFVAADAEFHRTVWETSGNELLSRIWPMVEVAMRNLTIVSNRLYYDRLSDVAATHRPLVAALARRDPAAAQLFQEHCLDVWSHAEEEGAPPKRKPRKPRGASPRAGAKGKA